MVTSNKEVMFLPVFVGLASKIPAYTYIYHRFSNISKFDLTPDKILDMMKIQNI